MKKLFFLVCLVTVVLSCDKIDKVEPENFQVEQNKEELIEWDVDLQDLELELQTIFSEDVSSWREAGMNEASVLIISIVGEKALFNLIQNTNASISKQVVCEETGVSFAGCCKKWLEAHPGDCLKISLIGETYYANDDCTP